MVRASITLERGNRRVSQTRFPLTRMYLYEEEGFIVCTSEVGFSVVTDKCYITEMDQSEDAGEV